MEEFSPPPGKTKAVIGSVSDVPQMGGTLTGDRRSSGEKARESAMEQGESFHAH